MMKGKMIFLLIALLTGSCRCENDPCPTGTLFVDECHNGNYKIMWKGNWIDGEYSAAGLMETIRAHRVKKIVLTLDKADLGIDYNARFGQFCREKGITLEVIVPTSVNTDAESEE